MHDIERSDYTNLKITPTVNRFFWVICPYESILGPWGIPTCISMDSPETERANETNVNVIAIVDIDVNAKVNDIDRPTMTNTFGEMLHSG